MKKVILSGLILLLSTGVSFAGGYNHHGKKIVIKKITNVTNTTNVINNYLEEKNEYGAKLDAPNLVKLHENWFVGVEGGKDLYQTDSTHGWFGYGKVTYTGTWFDFGKK